MGADGLREVKTIGGDVRPFRPHVHDELSLAYVWAGATLASIGGTPVPVSGECLVLIGPGVVHACNPVPGTGWNYTLALLAGPGGTALDRALGAAPWRILAPTGRLRTLFLHLRAHGAEAGMAPALRAAVAAALAAVPAPPGPGQPGGPPAPSRALLQVMGQLRTRMDRPLSLEQMSRLAGLSKYHLVRAFKAAFGLTPHGYHLNLRINAAKARLRAGQDPASVALDFGFCDQGHFTRVFSRCVGLPPAAYRRATAIPSKLPARPRT